MHLAKVKKNLPPKINSFLHPPKKNLIKDFYALNKNPLGETGCLSNLYYLLAAQVSSFLIQPLSKTQSVRTSLVPYHSVLM